MRACSWNNEAVIWLGDKAGNLSDWVTQQWVRTTGRRIDLRQNEWLNGPVGKPRGIGKDFYKEYAAEHDLEISREGIRGLLENFSTLSVSENDLSKVAIPVRDFYEQTSEYNLDVWSEWHGLFRPFGALLGIIFSRRLQQMNVPLSSMDTSEGMSSDVIQLRELESRKVRYTAWVREIHATRRVCYAGNYSITFVPKLPFPCVRVVFPLPNGNAVVLMRPQVNEDGSITIASAGSSFGDAGFYFVVHGDNDKVWARYLSSMKEWIRVYAMEEGVVRADHTFRLWGCKFMKLHYRMQKRNTP
jgi:hypothetical protein